MSRRGYAPSDIYEDHESDYRSRRGGGRTREYEEIDIRETRRREPEFLKEDYGRSEAGPLVVRERKEEKFESRPRRERPRAREAEKDELIISRGLRERDSPRVREVEREEIIYKPRERPAPREVEREEIIYRNKEKSPLPPPSFASERDEFIYRRREREPPAAPQIAREREEFVFRARPRSPPRPRSPSLEREEIIIRRGERDKPRPRSPSFEKEEIVIRRGEREKPRPRSPSLEREEIVIRRGEREKPRPRERSYEREEILIRRDERERPRERERGFERDELIIRRDERSRERPRPRETSFERDAIVIRRDEREGPRGRDFKEEDIIIRRDERSRSRSRRREPDFKQEEIIIRRKEREPEPEPEPEPIPEPIVRAPPIHQEIITHHRHIDHGFEIERKAAVAPTPPRRRSPSPESSFEKIEIQRRGSRNGRSYDDDIIIERDSGGRKGREERSTRRRSSSGGARSRIYSTRDEREIEEEAEYYNHRAQERAYIGEGYNGATKDWAIVDVPPGTKRVNMEGIGGGREEITWQRYNGVRRSKFVADEEVYGGEMEVAITDTKVTDTKVVDTRDRGRRFVGQKPKTETMWTEITKDLVIKEAIEESGYDFEETEFFFYVMSYLRYEDVLKLVDLTEDIKSARRERIREIEYERQVIPERQKQLALPWDEEKIFEREVIYESPPPPRRTKEVIYDFRR